MPQDDGQIKNKASMMSQQNSEHIDVKEDQNQVICLEFTVEKQKTVHERCRWNAPDGWSFYSHKSQLYREDSLYCQTK